MLDFQDSGRIFLVVRRLCASAEFSKTFGMLGKSTPSKELSLFLGYLESCLILNDDETEVILPNKITMQ